MNRDRAMKMVRSLTRRYFEVATQANLNYSTLGTLLELNATQVKRLRDRPDNLPADVFLLMYQQVQTIQKLLDAGSLPVKKLRGPQQQEAIDTILGG